VLAQTRTRYFGWLAALLMTLASGGSGAVEPEAANAGSDADVTNYITREGVKVRFSLRPIRADAATTAVSGDWADITFRVTDAGTGEPIKGRYPAAWMDLAEAWEAKGERPMSCKDRVATYLQGIVGVRPMIDLNSHFLLVMNRDASISVIDPTVGITGITNLFAQVNLSRPGADWVLSGDHKRLFVTMPVSGKVAMVDTEAFKVTHEIEAGEQPMRVELQSDQRYLWIGNNADDEEKSGVTVIDAADLEPLAFIPTGPGHHEIAFSDDNRHAFVTNRDGGSVTVIDVQRLAPVKDIRTGNKPIAVATAWSCAAASRRSRASARCVSPRTGAGDWWSIRARTRCSSSTPPSTPSRIRSASASSHSRLTLRPVSPTSARSVPRTSV
jgi:YVTN family beta-propeller protein